MGGGLGNDVQFQTSRTYGQILRQNAFTPINVLLFGISIALVILGLRGDALMTASVVLANVLTGVVQESRAKRQLDRIALLARPTATVIRDGREQEIDPAAIVVGDALAVRPGDQILVDGVIVAGSRVDIDESLLTGESSPIPKQAGDEVYSGTFCVAGEAVYEAERVGTQSVAQQITAEARAFRDEKTPLQREVNLVIRAAAVVIVILGLLVLDSFRDIYSGIPVVESVRAAAVIVGLVPQGLYLMVTVTYAMAAVRMAGKGALIQRTNAVESMSHVDVLCLDKTGTLTTNRLQLESVDSLDNDPELVNRLLATYAASTTAPNRTIEAVAAGLPGEAVPPVDDVLFSSAWKWSALTFDRPDITGTYVLGAPEVLQPSLAEDVADGIAERCSRLTSRGQRALLFAYRPTCEPLHDDDGAPRLPVDLLPLAVISLSDELRPEAKETIAAFTEMGIALKIISGDNPDTVQALAIQAGLPTGGRTVSGRDLEELSDAELAAIAEEGTIFGRVTPRQKERIVRALRERDRYAAMVGDGVNDIPALKQANLAIAMRSGSQATRNVADLVLLDDSFGALPKALDEGRRILKGMQDIIRLFLVRTVSLMLLVVATSLLNAPFPVTPKHNAILALLTVGIPVVGLAAWARPGIPPRRLLRSAVHFVAPAILTITVLALTVYLFFLDMTGDVTTARTTLTTVMVLCGLVLIPYLQPPNVAWTGGNGLVGSWNSTILAGAMLALFVIILAVPPLRAFYEMVVLSWPTYVLLAFMVVGWATTLRFIWRLRIQDRLSRLTRPTLSLARLRLRRPFRRHRL